MRLTLTVDLAPFGRRLATLRQDAQRAVAVALHREHERIMTVAKQRTPVDTGALRASGHVRPPVIRGTEVVSEGGFGNQSATYAVFVHENLLARHPVGQAKFYESAILDGQTAVIEAVQRAWAQALTGRL